MTVGAGPLLHLDSALVLQDPAIHARLGRPFPGETQGWKD